MPDGAGTKMEERMKKGFICLLLVVIINAFAFAQKTNTNNVININGTIYYYKPSTTLSSPIPNLEGAKSIDTGNWYGENAAKAWVAMTDWVIEHCTESNDPIVPKQGERIYITSVHSYKGNTPESKRYAIGATMNWGVPSRDGITIYYWIVPKDEPMENGEKTFRSFAFNNW